MPDYPRALAPSRRHDEIAAELRRVRLEAQARYSEVDLLVAALQEHIQDLRSERDYLRSELTRLHDRTGLDAATWLPRGMKPPR